MKRPFAPLLALMLGLVLSSPLPAQTDWSIFDPTTSRPPDVQVLVMDLEVEVGEIGRYKLISLENLFHNLVRFPENLPRYVAHKTWTSGADNGFSVAEVKAGTQFTGFDSGHRMPSHPDAWIAITAIALPRETHDWSQWFAVESDVNNPGTPERLGFYAGYNKVDSLTFSEADTTITVLTPEVSDTTIVVTTWDTFVRDYGTHTWRFPGEALYLDARSAVPAEIPTVNIDGQLNIPSMSVTEGDSVAVTLTLTGGEPRTEDVSVQFLTRNGRFGSSSSSAATAGSDYPGVSSPQTVTFSPTENSKTFKVATTDDTTNESSEVFTIYFVGNHGVKWRTWYSWPGPTILVTIVDND